MIQTKGPRFIGYDIYMPISWLSHSFRCLTDCEVIQHFAMNTFTNLFSIHTNVPELGRKYLLRGFHSWYCQGFSGQNMLIMTVQLLEWSICTTTSNNSHFQKFYSTRRQKLNIMVHKPEKLLIVHPTSHGRQLKQGEIY